MPASHFVIEAPPPRSANRAVADRERRGVEHAIAMFQCLVRELPGDELAGIAEAVDAALGAEPDVARAALARQFAGGRYYTPAEQAALEIETQARAFRLRRDLLAGSLTAPQVAERLGVSRQTPHDRAKAGTLLAVHDRGSLRFPPWQLDPHGPDGVVARFPEVVRALRLPPLAKVNWLVRPNPYLEDRRPIDVLRTEPDRVVDAAWGTGPR